MPTRKQRRRREKEKRHDYEVVYMDADGNEVPSDEVEEETELLSPEQLEYELSHSRV